jgi:hypothetical protein
MEVTPFGVASERSYHDRGDFSSLHFFLLFKYFSFWVQLVGVHVGLQATWQYSTRSTAREEEPVKSDGIGKRSGCFEEVQIRSVFFCARVRSQLLELAGHVAALNAVREPGKSEPQFRSAGEARRASQSQREGERDGHLALASLAPT